MSQGGKKDEKPFRLQEHVEWIAVAFVLALTVRCFVVEAYQIPTGSMAPTLYGKNVSVTCPGCGDRFVVGLQDDRVPDRFVCPQCGRVVSPGEAKVSAHGGDRILVSKNLYLFSKPKRWDVFVFKSPQDTKQSMNFVKRVVGLPGEHIQLRDGQVFVNDVMVAKSERIQRILWQPVYSWRGDKSVEDWSPSGSWGVAPEGLVLKTAPATWETVEFGRRISDFLPYDAMMGQNLVSDISVAGHARLDSAEAGLAASVAADSRSVRALFVPDGTALKVQLRINEQPIAEKTITVPSNRSFDFTLFTYDGRSGVDVNGREALRYVETVRAEETPIWTRSNGVSFQGQGGKMLISGVEIKRDIYYCTGGFQRPDSMAQMPYDIVLPEGEYLGLGDNSPVSNDSRYWGPVPEGNILGKAFFLFWPPTRMEPVL